MMLCFKKCCLEPDVDLEMMVFLLSALTSLISGQSRDTRDYSGNFTCTTQVRNPDQPSSPPPMGSADCSKEDYPNVGQGDA